MPATKEAVQILVERAVEILRSQATPKGLADEESKTKFHAIFDGPAEWKARDKGLEPKQPLELSSFAAKGKKSW